MRCAIIRRPVKYLCPRNIDLFYEKMKIADDILERGVQAALRAIGFDNGWLGPRRVTSGRVRQSVSLATSARRSPDGQGVRPRVPLEDRAGLQTGAQRFCGVSRFRIAETAARVTSSGLRVPSRRVNRRDRASRSSFAAAFAWDARSSNRPRLARARLPLRRTSA